MATAGKGGSVVVDSTTLGEIGEWTLDEDINLEETPVFGDNVVTHTGTLKSASGSFSGYFDATDLGNIDPGTAITNLELYIDGTANVAAEAIISTRSVTNVVDGVAEIDIDFEMQTEPVWTTA